MKLSIAMLSMLAVTAGVCCIDSTDPNALPAGAPADPPPPPPAPTTPAPALSPAEQLVADANALGVASVAYETARAKAKASAAQAAADQAAADQAHAALQAEIAVVVADAQAFEKT